MRRCFASAGRMQEDLKGVNMLRSLEKKMKEDFKKRTGQDATYFEVW